MRRVVHFTVRNPQLCVTHRCRKYLTKCLTVDVLEQAQKYSLVRFRQLCGSPGSHTGQSIVFKKNMELGNRDKWLRLEKLTGLGV